MKTIGRSFWIVLIALPLLLGWYLYVNSLYASSNKPSEAPVITDLNADKLTSLINEHRLKIGLAPFIKDDRLCDIAKIRAPEVHLDELRKVPHIGFAEKYENYPAVLSENYVGAPNEEEALRLWLNSPPHRSAIEGSWKYACVATFGPDAVQIFSSFDNYDHNSVD